MPSLHKLLLHLQSNHQLSIEEKEISFDTLEEFYEWKEEFETSTCSLFVLKCVTTGVQWYESVLLLL